MSRLWRRITFLFGRSRALAELDEEMQLHLELREAELRARGMAPADAARAARLRFGNRTNLKERSDDSWGWSWLHGFGGDLGRAGRLVRARPLFALVVVVTLALGIGPSAAMFSVMNAIVLRHLPLPAPDRLVYLGTTGQPEGSGNTGDSRLTFSHAVFSRLRDQGAQVADVMAFVPLGVTKTAVRVGAAPEEASAVMVSGNFFSGLGVGTTCGRLLSPEDERTRAAAVVLSHAYWSRRFGQDCAVVGRTMQVKGVSFTIVGVAARGFVGVRGDATDLWVPFQDRLDLNAWGMRRNRSFIDTPDWWVLMLIARLAPGVTEDAALAQLRPPFFQAAYFEGPPRANEKPPVLSFESARGIAGLRQAVADPLALLLAMVGLVLIIACGNVALLLVARNSTREREFAVRVALGGGRAQLLRQLLAESLPLVLAATLLGWIFAIVATDALAAWSGLEVDLAPDRRVLLFTAAVSLLATLAFALAPLRSAASAPMHAGLGAKPATDHRQRVWVRRAVVALQVGMCLVLLVAAGLLARTVQSLERIPLGVRTDGLLVFGLSPAQRGQERAATVQFYQTLLERLRALPGVDGATLMENRIGSGWSNNNGGILVDGRSPPGDERAPLRWNLIASDHFRTLGTPLLQGREIGDADSADAPLVAVVNRTFATRYLPGQDPIGHTLKSDRNPARIVGVVADSKYTSVREQPIPTAYFSYQQMGHVSAMHVVVHVRGEAERAWPMVERVVRELAPDLPLEQPRTQQREFARNLTNELLFARLAAFFGLLAVLLVATGLYGTLAFAVSRRTAEIGVRMALGAQRGHVLWMVLREGLLVCTVGVAVGLPLALAGAHVLRSLLYGVAPGDPLTLGLALAGLIIVALGASLLPARRATAVHPMIALRAD